MIIDTHAHVFPHFLIENRARYLELDDTFKALYTNTDAPLATTEDLLRAMDNAKVDVSVITGLGWTNIDLAREANNHLLEEAKHSSGRLLPLCSVNPAWGQAAVDEVNRCAQAGALGIGELHPDTQGFALDDDNIMAPIMEIARVHDLVVMTHSSEPVGHVYPGKGKTTPQVLEHFIGSFPTIPIICSHFGGGLPFYALMPEIKQALTNVYFDTAASPLLYSSRVFQVCVDLVGAERILLGSDFPLITPDRLIRQIRKSNLTETQQARILGGNASRLFHLD